MEKGKLMKKIIALLLAFSVLTVLMLVSCTDNSVSIDSSDTTDTEVTPLETTAATETADGTSESRSESESDIESETTSALTESSEATSDAPESSETSSAETFPESMEGGDEFENDNEADYKDAWA